MTKTINKFELTYINWAVVSWGTPMFSTQFNGEYSKDEHGEYKKDELFGYVLHYFNPSTKNKQFKIKVEVTIKYFYGKNPMVIFTKNSLHFTEEDVLHCVGKNMDLFDTKYMESRPLFTIIISFLQ